MDLQRHIAKATIGGGGCSFTLEVLARAEDLCSEQDEDDRLVVGLEIVTPQGSWRSSALSVLRAGVADVARAAGPHVRRRGVGHGTIRFASCDPEPAVAFRFRFLGDTGRVEATVEIDEGLSEEIPSCREESPDSLVLQISPAESSAFADALEAIATRSPDRLAWTG